MRRSHEISAQTFLLFLGVMLCAVTAVICVFIRWGGTGALIGTYALLLVSAVGVLAFALRFMSSRD